MHEEYSLQWHYKDEDFVLILILMVNTTKKRLTKRLKNMDWKRNVGDEILHGDTLFEMIQPCTFIGLRSPCNNPLEFFFVVAEVVGKDIASHDVYDDARHYIKTGEKYVTVNYLNLKEDWGKKM